MPRKAKATSKPLESALPPPEPPGNNEPHDHDVTVVLESAEDGDVDNPPMDPMADVPTIPSDSAEPVTYEIVAPPPTSRKRGGARRVRQPAETAQVNKIMGSTASFRFYKLDELNKPNYIHEYSLDDINRVAVGDLEKFIQVALMPRYRAGTYMVEGCDARGEAVKRKQYHLLDPNPAVQAGAPGFVMEPLVMQTLVKRLTDPPPDPLEQLAKYKAVFGESETAKQSGTDPALLLMLMDRNKQQGPDPLSLMMLQSMQAQQAAMAQPLPMVAAAPPPEDNSLKLLELAKALRPEPQKPLLEQIMPILPFLEKLFGGSNVRDEMHALRIEHLTEKLAELRDAAANDNLRETLENVKLLRSFAREEGAGNENAVKYFFENLQPNLDALRNLITAGKASQAPQLPPGQPPANDNMARPEPPPPPQWHEAMTELEAAEEDIDRLNALLKSFTALYAHEYYRGVAVRFHTLLKLGKKDTLQKELSSYLHEYCVENKVLSEEQANATLRAYDVHFDEVREMVQAGSKDE